jgi:hypothetical protein
LCLSSSSGLRFYYYSFRVNHPVNRDDRHLLALAMASYFSVVSKRTTGFSLRVKLHAITIHSKFIKSGKCWPGLL